jgi:hypothetical protein
MVAPQVKMREDMQAVVPEIAVMDREQGERQPQVRQEAGSRMRRESDIGSSQATGTLDRMFEESQRVNVEARESESERGVRRSDPSGCSHCPGTCYSLHVRSLRGEVRHPESPVQAPVRAP